MARLAVAPAFVAVSNSSGGLRSLALNVPLLKFDSNVRRRLPLRGTLVTQRSPLDRSS
jgi:hypothetical protein